RVIAGDVEIPEMEVVVVAPADREAVLLDRQRAAVLVVGELDSGLRHGGSEDTPGNSPEPSRERAIRVDFRGTEEDAMNPITDPAAVRLTQTAKRAGCAAKHPPCYLLPLLAGLPAVTDPRVLIGSSTADDAAVIRIDAERALVFTTDFFTPIVDDPYDFGAVAAANALSDIYAMGARPLSALGLVGFPEATLPIEILREILRGGIEKVKETGCDVVGGHTIKTDEPIYGLAVVGEVHPDRVVSNAGARPGDALVLTKPLGVGIVSTANKQDLDSRGAM